VVHIEPGEVAVLHSHLTDEETEVQQDKARCQSHRDLKLEQPEAPPQQRDVGDEPGFPRLYASPWPQGSEHQPCFPSGRGRYVTLICLPSAWLRKARQGSRLLLSRENTEAGGLLENCLGEAAFSRPRKHGLLLGDSHTTTLSSHFLPSNFGLPLPFLPPPHWSTPCSPISDPACPHTQFPCS
jgi:hypothetical protein